MAVNAEEKPKDTQTDYDQVQENLWSIRPCFLYKEEYDDCKSIKARFHQYFIQGESTDCLPWKRDYDNCVRFEDNANDLKAAQEIIASEAHRRNERMKAHYQNTVWQKRKAPPADWSKPLPEWLIEKNKNTYLEIKANELRDAQNNGALKEERTLCTIM